MLCRFFTDSPDIEAIEPLADALIPTDRSSGFQHAMPEFAADVYTAQSPQCESCPIEEHCQKKI
jgi:A/G-specific adenine glycosylase